MVAEKTADTFSCFPYRTVLFGAKVYSYIHRLTAYLANELRFFQAVLFFFFIKYRPDAAVGIVGVAAQVSDILLLFIRVTNGDGAGNHCAIQLSMLADGDIKAAFARKDAGLLLHRVIVAVQFVFTHAEVGRAAARHRHCFFACLRHQATVNRAPHPVATRDCTTGYG